MSPSAYAGVIISVVVAFLALEYLFFRAFGIKVFSQNELLINRIFDGIIFWSVTAILVFFTTVLFHALGSYKTESKVLQGFNIESTQNFAYIEVYQDDTLSDYKFPKSYCKITDTKRIGEYHEYLFYRSNESDCDCRFSQIPYWTVRIQFTKTDNTHYIFTARKTDCSEMIVSYFGKELTSENPLRVYCCVRLEYLINADMGL